jgi:uncharacterized protein (UPF0216 family)
MAYRPRPDDEGVLRRWMSIEMGKINDGIVAERKRLSTLLAEEKPSSVTRGGKAYAFDRAVIRGLGEALPDRIRDRLRLPILFFFVLDVRDSYYLNDETAVRALQLLGEIGEMREMHEGRLWVGRAIALAIMRRYPTAVQIAIGT